MPSEEKNWGAEKMVQQGGDREEGLGRAEPDGRLGGPRGTVPLKLSAVRCCLSSPVFKIVWLLGISLVSEVAGGVGSGGDVGLVCELMPGDRAESRLGGGWGSRASNYWGLGGRLARALTCGMGARISVTPQLGAKRPQPTSSVLFINTHACFHIKCVSEKLYIMNIHKLCTVC